LETLRTERVPLKSLGVLIKPLVECLAIGRAKMVVEQIRQTAEIGGHERVIIMTTCDAQESDQPLAVAIAILQREGSTGTTSDVAIVVHAGHLGKHDQEKQGSIIAALSAGLDRQFREHGIKFVQWATDASDNLPQSPNPVESDWCHAFGFQPIGTLDYLSGPVSDCSNEPFSVDADQAIRFHKYSWSDRSAFQDLAELVQATCVDTLDCPRLSEYRTTEQVLSGYQTSDAFDPDLWFIAKDSSGKEVGCAIFAVHGIDKQADRADAPLTGVDAPLSGSVEIVYMGLKADSRGKRYGEQLVKHAFDVAREIGANQVLLAVDRINTPAKSIYLRAGLKPIVNETVWVKLIDHA